MEWEVRWPDGRAERVTAADGETWTWKPVGPGVYDVRMGTRNVRVESLGPPNDKGFLRLRVNGVEQTLQVLDDQHLLLESMGMNAALVSEEHKVEAPMPGKVLNVLVNAGSEVKEGEGLLVLEAMKMENVIRAPRAGRIESITTEIGLAVEKGTVLVTYEMIA